MKAKERVRKPEVGVKPAAQEVDGRVTALALKEGVLSGEMQAYFAKCDEKIGFVPNVLRAYAHDNQKLEAFAAFYNDLMLAPSGLSKLEREMIAVVVSSQNRCYYCLTAHGAAVRQLSGDPVLAEMLVQNYRAAELGAPPPRHARLRREAHRRALYGRGAGPGAAARGRVLGPRHLGRRRRRVLLQHVEPDGVGGRYAPEPGIPRAGQVGLGLWEYGRGNGVKTRERPPCGGLCHPSERVARLSRNPGGLGG